MSDIGKFLCETFPSLTEDMYNGNEPAGRGHERLGGGYLDRWETRYGGGESWDGEINHANFSLNHKVTIYIVGNHLRIVDGRHDGKTDLWEYTNIPTRNLSWTVMKKHYHTLEPERIEKYLNTKIENCKFWDMVQAKAKELYAAGTIQPPS